MCRQSTANAGVEEDAAALESSDSLGSVVARTHSALQFSITENGATTR